MLSAEFQPENPSGFPNHVNKHHQKSTSIQNHHGLDLGFSFKSWAHDGSCLHIAGNIRFFSTFPQCAKPLCKLKWLGHFRAATHCEAQGTKLLRPACPTSCPVSAPVIHHQATRCISVEVLMGQSLVDGTN